MIGFWGSDDPAIEMSVDQVEAALLHGDAVVCSQETLEAATRKLAADGYEDWLAQSLATAPSPTSD